LDACTATAPQPTELIELLRLGQKPDARAFIQRATVLLDARGADGCDELRLLLIRRLAEHGLLARARAVTQQFSPAFRARPEYHQLTRALGVPGSAGTVSWSCCAARFQANLVALAVRPDWAPWRAEIATAWENEGRHLELHASRTLGWQIFDPRPGPTYGWRPAFADHRPAPSVDSLRPALTKPDAFQPLAIEGVGLGEHLPWLCKASRDPRTGQGAVIYQLEPSWLALAVALHLADWTSVLADPRVRLCCGPDALAQFERAAQADAWNVPPQKIFQTHRWASAHPRAADSARKLVCAYQQRQSVEQAEIDATFGQHDPAWWQRRFAAALSGSAPPLRVLGITCRFTTVLKYSMRDALNAFAARGCVTDCLIEPNDYSCLHPRRIIARVQKFRPDLIFLIDHTRRLLNLEVSVPVVSWIQDRLPWLFNAQTGAALGPLDFCLGFNRKLLVDRYSYPAARFLPCEMATNPAVLLPSETAKLAALHAAPDPRYACDLAYATNFAETPDEFHARLRDTSHFESGASLRRLLDALYEDLRARQVRGALDGGLWWEEVVRNVARALGAELTPESQTEIADAYVRPLADRMLRLQTVAWAARWAQETGRTLHLYGKGWEQHPEYGRYARGFLEHGPELGAAFRSAKVHVHAGCNPAFHQRVLDGLAAGGFLLVRRHAGDQPTGKPWPAEEQFADGEQEALSAGDFWPELTRLTFASYEELAARLEGYLAQPGERAAIADAMRDRMLAHFSYQAVIARLLAWMTPRLGNATS
jgi:hypothetical protein